ncbi:MAG: CYTH domain-containing protein [Candidatus Komeilibacteria bacterium]|nr:CYTH domain-containing protein [Candidatus Komeilibacteria bacterium]
MKKEVEIKILNIDKKKIKSLLKKSGAKQILKPNLMKEMYLESPAHERLYSAFRLRSEGKKNFLTLKLKKGTRESKKFQVRDELEVEIGDFNTAKKIIQLAGFKIFRKREKIREKYKLNKSEIEIDEYPKMKPYLEIETSSAKEMSYLIKILGISLKYATNKTATEIIRGAGLNPDNLFFKE